jgi:hypothetical protein
MFEDIWVVKNIRMGVDERGGKKCLGLQDGVKVMANMVIQKCQRAVLTNQCLGKETNAEPPGPSSN